MHVPDDLQAVFGGGNGSTGSGDRGLQAEEEPIFSTKEGQTVLATRNPNLLWCYSGLFEYAVRHNVDLTKTMDEANIGARLPSKVTRYQIASSHYHTQQSVEELPLRARATHLPLRKKLESVVKTNSI